MLSRRTFLQQGTFALAALGCLDAALAAGGKTGPLGRPIGIQLYTVRQETAKDLEGTLKQLGAIGFQEVEMAGYYNKSAKELRTLLQSFGLTPTSAHRGLPDLLAASQKEIDYVAELGIKNLVVPFPAVPDNRFANQPKGSKQTIANSMTLDDWKWIADQLNKLGEMSKKVGIRMGYHNHNMEFRTIDGKVAFDQLIAWTDPSLVTIELDIAWVVAAGYDPVAYLKRYPERISMLHVKDVKKDIKPVVDEVETVTTEVGSGKVDWEQLFAAVNAKHLKHYYYEQEDFERPILEAAKISFDYLTALKV